MNAILSEGNVVRNAKRILGLAGLASLALVCAGLAWAQGQPSQTQSSAAPSGATVPSASPGVAPSGSAPAAKEVMAQNSPARVSAPKGQSEGIKVHGHWTIEIRNPDGKVITHREFENSLAPPNPNNQNLGGAALLASLLGRTLAGGSWSILLSDTPGDGPNYINVIAVSEPNSVAASACNANWTCSSNLSVSGGNAANPTTVTFSGSAPVPQSYPAQIGWVGTLALPCQSNEAPTTCFSASAGSVAGGIPFTARPLDGNTAAGAAAGDPNPVPVTPNQTVAVTVTISFQ